MSPALVRHSLLQNRASLRFTFVRHPYERFVSAWQWSQREVEVGAYEFDSYEQDAIKGHSMLHVSRRLREITSTGHAIHFYPQSSYIFDGERELVNWIGRFENLEKDFDTIARRLGISRRIKFGPNVRSPEGPQTSVGLSIEVRKHLDEFYSEDFKRFGYRMRGDEAFAPILPRVEEMYHDLSRTPLSVRGGRV